MNESPVVQPLSVSVFTLNDFIKKSTRATADGLPNRVNYRGADNSLARPGRKQATATEDSEFHISYL